MSIAPISSVLTTLWNSSASTVDPELWDGGLTTADSNTPPPRPRGALSEKLLTRTLYRASQEIPEPIVGRATHFYPTAQDKLDLPATSMSIALATKAQKMYPGMTILDSGLTYFGNDECGIFTRETPLGLIYETHASLNKVREYRRGKIVHAGKVFDFVVSVKEEKKPKIIFLVNEQDQACEIKENNGTYLIVPLTEKKDAILGLDHSSDSSCWIRHEGRIYQNSRRGCYYTGSHKLRNYRSQFGFLFQELGLFVTEEKKIIDLNTPFPHQPQAMSVTGCSCVYWHGRLFFHRHNNIYQEPESDRQYRLTTYADGGQALVELNGEIVDGRWFDDEFLDFEMAQSKYTQDWYYTLSSDHAKNSAALVEILQKSQEKSGTKRRDHYVIVPVSRLLATSDDVIEDVFDESSNRVVRTYHDESEALYVGLSHIVTSHVAENGENFLTQEDWENPQIEYVIVPGGFVVYKKDITETTPHEWQGTRGILFTQPPLKTWPQKRRFANQKPVNDYKTFIAGGQHYAFTPGETEKGNSSPHLLWQEDAGGLFRLVAGAQILTLSQEIRETYFETAEAAKMRKDVLEVFHRATTAEKIAELKPWADAFSRQDPVYVKDGKIWNLAEVSHDFTPVMASPFSIYTTHQWRPENVIVFRKLPDGVIRPATLAELAAHLEEKLPPLPEPYLDAHQRIIGAMYAARVVKKSITPLKPVTVTLEKEFELNARVLKATSVRMHRLKITRGQGLPDCILFYPTLSDPFSQVTRKKTTYYVPTKKDALILYDMLYKIFPKKVADQIRSIQLFPAAPEKASGLYDYETHELTVFAAEAENRQEWLTGLMGPFLHHEVLGHGLTDFDDPILVDLALKTLVLDSALAEYGTTNWAEYIATLAEYYSWQPRYREKMPWGFRLVHKIIMDFLTY